MRRLLLTALTLMLAGVLSACGFTPMHSPSASSVPLSKLQIEVIKGSDVVDNQAGFFILQRLKDRIGENTGEAPYRLELTPRYRRARFGLTDADIASRYDITVSTRWRLIETKTGNTVESGTASSTSTFGAPEGPYGVITADNVGVEQAAKETADRLILQMARTLAAQET